MREKEMLARMTLTTAVAKLAAAQMGWSEEKGNEWMMTDNPHFGGVAPATLIMRGRSHKVLAFIEAAIAGESP